MQYRVLMLNFDNPVPVGSSGLTELAPWGNEPANRKLGTRPSSDYGREYRPDRAFTIDTPEERHIVINDDDPYLREGNSTPDETGQTLATPDVVLEDGSPFLAGTMLSAYIGSRLIDEDGNVFRVQFPREFAVNGFGEELGGRQSVLVFPEPRIGEAGNSYLPEFDASKSFNLMEIANYRARDPNSYPQFRTEAQCFTQGTMILTTTGSRPVETLRPGDLVVTRDHGPRPIRWIGGSNLDPRQLDLQPNLRPILIRAGALGHGMPQQDLAVSPQHRVLVNSKIACRMFDKEEILVAAKHLVSLPGIDAINPKNGVSYWHMLFDGHELVLSNGSWTESLYTGPQALNGINEAARREILALFPELARPDYRANAARRLLSGREGRKLIERHIKNGKPLIGQI